IGAAALGASASTAQGTIESAAPGTCESAAPGAGLHLPSFSTNLVSGADLQDAWVGQFTPGGQCETHCTCSRTGRHLATFTHRPRSSLYTMTTASPPDSASSQVAASGQGFPDALDIPTPRSYAEAIEGPYTSQWQAAMDTEMASWNSTGTYVDEVPPPRANMVSGMWIFRVKRPPGSPPVFKARYVVRGFRQQQGVNFFQTFSPTPKMTTLRVLLHDAAQRDYELHSLDFSTAFLQGSLHEEIWLRRPPGFIGWFPAGTQWSLRRPVYSLRQAPREWHDTLRTTLAALGFAPSTADPSLFLNTDTSLPPFYVLVYVDDLVFATADTEALAHVLQRFGFQFSSALPTPLSTSHSLSAPRSDESVEPSGPYPELVGCLIQAINPRSNIVNGMWIFRVKRPPGSPLVFKARYVARGFNQRQGVDFFQTFSPTLKMTTLWVLLRVAAQRDYELHSLDFTTAFVLQRFGFTYSSPQPTPLPTSHSLSAPPYPQLVGCLITSGMGLMLGGRAQVILTGHTNASWSDDLTTQRSSQGYTFSLGSGFVSWQSTRSSSVLISGCEAEIYTRAMAAQGNEPVLLLGRARQLSSCEAEIYAGAMAAQELRWLTYLLSVLGEPPRSPPMLYVDNKAMIAFCQEHRLEHRTKHIALRYFLAQELQERGQLHLAYVASRANTADIFTKALQPCDHQPPPAPRSTAPAPPAPAHPTPVPPAPAPTAPAPLASVGSPAPAPPPPPVPAAPSRWETRSSTMAKADSSGNMYCSRRWPRAAVASEE
ncbi:unnamed protein product, partial [Closterium sp. NIES-53]